MVVKKKKGTGLEYIHRLRGTQKDPFSLIDKIKDMD